MHQLCQNKAILCVFVFYRDQKDGCSWLDPSAIGVVPYATAGLPGLYTQVTSQEPALNNGKYLDI